MGVDTKNARAWLVERLRGSYAATDVGAMGQSQFWQDTDQALVAARHSNIDVGWLLNLLVQKGHW